MASSGPPSARTEFFQKLKPLCIPLSQLAIRSQDKAANANEIHDLLKSLLTTWEAQIRQDASVPDEKLADYVFFPVSHVLRSQDAYPMRLIETTIKLLRVLIQNGWKSKISKDLSQQLLMFLTFIVGGIPDQPRKRDVPEETILEGYLTLGALITATGSSGTASAALLEDRMVPLLGHAVYVVLDGVSEGKTPDIQLAALDCLHAVYTGIKDHQALASFLPRTISSLTHTLGPPSSLKAPARVLIRGLRVLKTVLSSVIGDMKARNILKDMKDDQVKDNESETKETAKILTPVWLKATASQIKIALSSVLKLRTHDSANVQQAVYKFCIALLDECHKSLAECKTILVESTMMLQQDDEETNHSALDTSLEDLASIYPELGDTIRSVMYNWVTGLPRMMQSGEERVKQQAIRNFLRGNRLIAALHIDSFTLQDSIADALKDSLVALITSSKQSGIISEEVDENPMKAVALTRSELGSREYSPIILTEDGQRGTRNEVHSLITSIGSPAQQIKLASEMLSYLRDSEGVDQIASFWLSFELVKASYAARSSSDDLDMFLDLSSTQESEQQDAVFHELYDFSASIIASHSDEADSRLEAIALEVAAYAASRMQTEFQPELIDVLYPITTFMGSQNVQLRSHAITTLNIIASSCGYVNVSDLIIDNVDYMVNSLSLRLNTFDISPASTRVLNMMIRLSGPKLIPFLDDVVASIFAALDNYHGYPVFVESLFSVLSEVVEQGSQSDNLFLEGGTAAGKFDHKKKPPQPEAEMEDLLTFLRQNAERNSGDREGEDSTAEDGSGHPWKPWGPPKDAKKKSFLDTLEEMNSTDDAEEDSPSANQDLDKPKPPPTPTYTLLSRITTLTQHHLTSPSPSLRRQLLALLSRAAPALAQDEDSFLPLVNAVWPVIVARLRDSEPFVVIAACDALASLCETAGDFLASRIRTEWGDWMAGWCRRVKKEADGEKEKNKRMRTAGGGGRSVVSVSGSLGRVSGLGEVGQDILLPSRVKAQPAELVPLSSSPMADMRLVQTASTGASAGALSSNLGRFAQSSQVWSAVVRLLTAVVSYVRLDDEGFDEILELLVDVIADNEEVRRALENVNHGAVWLALYERGQIDVSSMAVPVMEGVTFTSLDRV